MTALPIIIAEKDPAGRTRLARALTTGTCPVVVTASAAELLEYLLHNDCRVVVIGSTVEESLPLALLIQLIKRCNQGLAIILISDRMPLGQERALRHAGIFYHATWPGSTGDWTELQTAVACARSKTHPPSPFRRHGRAWLDPDFISKGVIP